jgi:hypothetical protein
MQMKNAIPGTWYNADFSENFNIIQPMPFYTFYKKLREKRSYIVVTMSYFFQQVEENGHSIFLKIDFHVI